MAIALPDASGDRDEATRRHTARDPQQDAVRYPAADRTAQRRRGHTFARKGEKSVFRSNTSTPSARFSPPTTA